MKLRGRSPIAAITLCTAVLGCAEQATEQAATREVKTVLFEGSEVQVSWNPAAKTKATLTHDSSLNIWSNDAAELISEATGCEAQSWSISYPDDGSGGITMPIKCE